MLTAALWFLAKLLRYAFPALFPAFRTEFGVSTALLGTAFTAMMVVYSLMQFPSGALADRVGGVRVVATGGVTAAVGAAVVVVSGTFVGLVAGMLLVGLGTGLHKTVSIGVLSRVYPDRTGRALGLFDTLGAAGGVAAPAAVVVSTATADWHALFFLGAVASLCLASGVVLRVPQQSRGGRSAGSGNAPGVRRYLAVLRDRRVATFVAATVCFGFAYNGVVAFLPLFLTTGGLSGETASLLYGVLFAASLGQVLTGDLSDRFGRLPLAATVLGVAAVSLWLLVAVGSAGPTVAGLTVLAFGLGGHGFRPIRGALLAATIPEEVSGGGLGLVRTVLKGIGALAPAVVGILAEARGFAVAFGLLATSMTCAAVLTAALALVEAE